MSPDDGPYYGLLAVFGGGVLAYLIRLAAYLTSRGKKGGKK